MNLTFEETIKLIFRRDERYRPEAYSFLMEALSFTQKLKKKACHVSGEDLLEGFKLFSVKTFGSFAPQVLARWGIYTSEDVGYIVFNLVNSGILGREPEDHFESFIEGPLLEPLTAIYKASLTRAARRLK